MLVNEIEVGMHVRYPRTGTSGAILRIELVEGSTFAELDSTHLFYRVDQLIPASANERKTITLIDDAKEVIAREQKFASGGEFQEALKNIDQSCEGGG